MQTHIKVLYVVVLFYVTYFLTDKQPTFEGMQSSFIALGFIFYNILQ